MTHLQLSTSGSICTDKQEEAIYRLINELFVSIESYWPRIVVCGAISQYNNEAVVGPKNYLSLLVNRASMEGMVVFDYTDRYHIAVQEMNEYLSSGKMKSKEDVVLGIERFSEALNMLFTGRNFGKLVLKVNE